MDSCWDASGGRNREAAAERRTPRGHGGRPRPTPADEAAVGRMAISLNAALELDDVLDVLCREVLAHTTARRVGLLLSGDDAPGLEDLNGGAVGEVDRDETGRDPFDAPRRLQPGNALAREHGAELWQALRALGPVELNAAQRRAFARARPAVLIDAERSELLPAGWAQRLRLELLVLVPLFAAGVPCGLLALDYARHAAVDAQELGLLESMAEHAGVAVANARRYARVRRQARIGRILADASGAFTSTTSAREVAEQLARAVGELLETDLVGVGVVRDDQVQLLAVAGDRALPPSLPRAEPLDHIAVLAARTRCGAPAAEVLAAAETLAVIGGAALRRHRSADWSPTPAAATPPRPGRPRGSRRGPEVAPGVRLTLREAEVLDLVARGLSNPQIAERLRLSRNTVKTHLSQVFAKLEVADRGQATRRAHELGLVR